MAVVQPSLPFRFPFCKAVTIATAAGLIANGISAVRMISRLLLLLENILTLVVSLPQALVAFVRDWLHFWKLASRFPGPLPDLIFTNLFGNGFVPNALNLFKWALDDVMPRYPAGQLMIGPLRFILLSDVNDLKSFLMNPKNQSKPNLMIDFASYGLGSGLITINGSEWNKHHKIIQPSFHHNLLKTYVAEYDRQSDIFIENLSKHANGCAFDIQLLTETLGVDILVETLFGVPSNQQTNPDKEMFEHILRGQNAMSHRVKCPWLYNNRIYNISPAGHTALEVLKYFRSFQDTFVKQRKELLRARAERQWKNENFEEENTPEDVNDAASEAGAGRNKKKLNIFIDALLRESGRSISYQSVLDEMQSFLMAGIDTSAITLQFAFYFLAKNPLVQEKALRELQNIFGAAGPTEVTADSLQHMQYVEMIIKETLRLHPPIFFYMKKAGVDTPLVSSDLVVPAGATVLISPRTVHMDPKLYPDPQVFDPERFSPENSAERHPLAFIAFAAGNRACIGRKFAMMSLKTILSKVIWNFRILPDETYEPELLWGISMVTANGMRIKLLKR